jgi:hypothetical protein
MLTQPLGTRWTTGGSCTTSSCEGEGLDDQRAVVKALTFERLVEEALDSVLDIESIEREPGLLAPVYPDFIAHLRDGRVAIIEVKSVTPATSIRLEQAAAQLRNYRDAYVKAVGKSGRPPELVLVVSGALAQERVARLKSLGIGTVIDGPTLRTAAPTLSWPDSVAQEPQNSPDTSSRVVSTNALLIEELERIQVGQQAWVLYQRKVRDILAALLCPPLEEPLSEDPNMTGVNRRDIIFPNYAETGLWKFFRDHYAAHFLVVEAKNSTRVTKNNILQIANYLNPRGLGLFGIITCRTSAAPSAEVTRREQWIMHDKLIIVLNDDDLKQMASFASDRTDPAIVIRQKVEDFRRSI